MHQCARANTRSIRTVPVAKQSKNPTTNKNNTYHAQSRPALPIQSNPILSLPPVQSGQPTPTLQTTNHKTALINQPYVINSHDANLTPAYSICCALARSKQLRATSTFVAVRDNRKPNGLACHRKAQLSRPLPLGRILGGGCRNENWGRCVAGEGNVTEINCAAC
ncbi:hypothetical protein B9Z19DRAFT_148777 [Tuber borchii]|uniref:Uncharacterized protein n=1 Tax=Tuber borchii TaxID=42251 RepID=A0A2T6ZQ90_TUBBO|nr:hypothetical protein B9Z19DRAFT_148777 [Tuber borchii]